MDTLQRLDDDAAATGTKDRSRYRLVGAVSVGAVVVVAAALIAYAIGSHNSSTRVVVKAVTAAPAPSPPSACLPGAAPGSCNIDEARQAQIPDQPLNAATRATLAKQLIAARTAALRYPTVADALNGGFVPAGKFSPETGAHYVKLAVPSGFDPANPGSLIYDGNSPTSKIIGLMYLSMTLNPPEGFAGPNDHWHRHTNTCVEFTGGKIVVPFAADSSVTKAQCDGVHGDFMRETVWMVHAWVVPGWESPLGVFSHNNPDVKCADGTEHTDAVGFCQGT